MYVCMYVCMYVSNNINPPPKMGPMCGKGLKPETLEPANPYENHNN